RALRLDPAAGLSAKLRAELAYREAEELERQGLIDLAAYQRVLELDPSHGGARTALERHDADARERRTRFQVVLASISTALAVVLGALAWLAHRRATSRA